MKNKILVIITFLYIFELLYSEASPIDIARELDSVKEALDFVWILTASALVFLMQAGLMS